MRLEVRKRRWSVVGAATQWVAVIAVVIRGPLIARAQNVDLLSQIGGSVEAVNVVGNLALVGEGQTLVVFDVTNPSSPRPIGSVLLDGFVQQIVTYGTHAYVTNYGDDYLNVVDVTDPESPLLVNTVSGVFYGDTITVFGKLLFVGDGSDLHIFDLSDPVFPEELESFDIHYSVQAMAITDSFAVVASYLEGGAYFQTIDVSNPSNPNIVGALFVDDQRATKIAMAGPVACVTLGDDGLEFIDFSDPTHPVLLGQFNTAGYAADLVVANPYVIVFEEWIGIEIFDASNPFAPVSISVTPTYDGAASGVVQGTNLYVADSSSLTILNVSNPNTPVPLAYYPTPTQLADAVTANGFVYAVDRSNLWIFDATDPTEPFVRSRFALPGPGNSLAITGPIVQVAAGHGGLKLFDVSYPSAPLPLGSIATADAANEIATSGTLTVVGFDQSRVDIIDVSIPTNPRKVGSRATDSAATGIVVAGDRAYIAEQGGGLRILNLSNPAAPYLVASYDTGTDSVNDVAVAGNTAYIVRENGTSEEDMEILDITSLGFIHEIGSVAGYHSSRTGLVVSGQFAFRSSSSSFSVIDVSNSSLPAAAAGYDGGFGVSHAIAGPLAFVPAGNLGLFILKTSIDRGESRGSTIPPILYTGSAIEVTVPMKNTGTTLWSAADSYELRVLTDLCGITATRDIVIEPSVVVHPGEAHDFHFTLHAPATPTACTIQFQMRQGSSKYFGDILSAPMQVVDRIEDAVVVGNTTPPVLPPGASVGIGITIHNAGNTTWSAGDGYTLTILEDACGLFGGATSIEIPEGTLIGPNQEIQFLVQIVAPNSEGNCGARLRMTRGDEGFGGEVVMHVQVAEPRNAWDPLESTCRHASLSIL